MNAVEDFKKLNPDYPVDVSGMTVVESVEGDGEIPSGDVYATDGERYDYNVIIRTPLSKEVMNRVSNPKLQKYAKECNERNWAKGFKLFKINGHPILWNLRVGPSVKAPDAERMSSLIGRESKNEKALLNHDVTKEMINRVIYDLLREDIGRHCNMPADEAGNAIEKRLDCGAMVDVIDGHIYAVPNWALRTFPDDTYVKQMLEALNKR